MLLKSFCTYLSPFNILFVGEIVVDISHHFLMRSFLFIKQITWPFMRKASPNVFPSWSTCILLTTSFIKEYVLTNIYCFRKKSLGSTFLVKNNNRKKCIMIDHVLTTLIGTDFNIVRFHIFKNIMQPLCIFGFLGIIWEDWLNSIMFKHFRSVQCLPPFIFIKPMLGIK